MMAISMAASILRAPHHPPGGVGQADKKKKRKRSRRPFRYRAYAKMADANRKTYSRSVTVPDALARAKLQLKSKHSNSRCLVTAVQPGYVRGARGACRVTAHHTRRPLQAATRMRRAPPQLSKRSCFAVLNVYTYINLNIRCALRRQVRRNHGGDARDSGFIIARDHGVV